MRLYMRYLSIHLRSAMQHKGSLAMMTVGQFLISFAAFISIYFLFARFGEVDGFTFNEVLLCYAAVLTSHSIAECFACGLEKFPRFISNGEFDRIMVRPRNEIFQVIAAEVELMRLGRLVQALLVICYAIPNCGVNWTPSNISVLAGMLVGGVAVFSALFLMYAGLAFFTIEGLEFMNVFTYGGRDHGAYPMGVYGKGILAFYTFVVPLACVQYYPLLFLLGRAAYWWYALTPLAGVAFMLPAYLLWRTGVRHYKSTGS